MLETIHYYNTREVKSKHGLGILKGRNKILGRHIAATGTNGMVSQTKARLITASMF